jgi:predicted RNA-binding protein YlxR (DUF448 family)
LPRERRKHVPLRSCVACQRKRPKRELIRVVRTPEGTIEVDPRGKRSGRGAYLCADRSCWEMALLHRKLGQALRCAVSAEEVAELRTAAASLLATETVVESQMVAAEVRQAEGRSE